MENILRAVALAGWVPTVYVTEDAPLAPLAHALRQGWGCAAQGNARVLRALRAADRDMLLGALVSDEADIDAALDAGADYILSPDEHNGVLAACARKRIPALVSAERASQDDRFDALVEQRDWQGVTGLVKGIIDRMLGFSVRHVGINSGSPEQARRDVEALMRLTGWQITGDGEKSTMVGTGVECMKSPFRGRFGHIALATKDVERAQFYLESRGFVFDDAPISVCDGKPMAIYLRDDVAGFAIHLLQS